MAKRMKANQPTLSAGVNGALSLGIAIPMPPPTVKVSAHTRMLPGSLSPNSSKVSLESMFNEVMCELRSRATHLAFTPVYQVQVPMQRRPWEYALVPTSTSPKDHREQWELAHPGQNFEATFNRVVEEWPNYAPASPSNVPHRRTAPRSPVSDGSRKRPHRLYSPYDRRWN